jgi:LemA protein
MIPVYVLVAIAAITGVGAVVIFNGLIRLTNQVKNAWSQIDVQLQRRHNLIPNLVETVKGYAKHERELFEAVTQARGTAMAASGVQAQAQAENVLSRALGNLLAVAENYPDLKASQNFLALQEELSSTENKIAFARQFYNDSAMHLNTKSQSFPSNIVASLFSFKAAEFFEIDEPDARSVPKVEFGA